jgi:hypothetical protein
MNEQRTHSRSAYLCGGFLFLIAIAGNLSVPWLLDRSFPFQNSHSPYARIYFQLCFTVYEGLVSFCAGLWIAQYFVSWIWLNAHVANTVMRWMLGIFSGLTISCTVALERVWLSYAVELGLVLGVGIVIPLLPKAKNAIAPIEPESAGSSDRWNGSRFHIFMLALTIQVS